MQNKDDIPEFTVNDIIEEIGWGRFQYCILAIVSFLMMIDGFEIMVIDILAPIISCQWKLTSSQVVIFTVSVLGGMALGCIFLGNLADKFGRRKTIIYASIQVLVMSLISAFSPIFSFLVISRTFFGVFLAAGFQGASLVLELTPIKQRAFVNTLTNVFWSAGMMLGVSLGFIIKYLKSWRIYLLIAAIPTLIASLASMKIPESARFYIATGKKKEAKELLKLMASQNNTDVMDFKLKDRENLKNMSFWDLFKKGYRKTSFLMILATFSSWASYFGLVFIQPLFVWHSKSNGHLYGNCEISCYDVPKDYMSLILPSIFEIIGSFILPYIWNTYGRRKPTIICMLITAFCSSLLFINIKSMAIISIIFCIARLSCYFAGTVCVLYTAELYPTEIRSMAVGVGCCSNKFGSLFGTFLTQSFYVLSPNLSIFNICMWSLLCVISLVLLKKETMHSVMEDNV